MLQPNSTLYRLRVIFVIILVLTGILGLIMAIIWPSPSQPPRGLTFIQVLDMITGSGTPLNNQTGPTDAHIFLGQSQMRGFGRTAELPPQLLERNTRLLQLDPSGWKLFQPRDFYIGPPLSFVWTLLNVTDRQIAVIKIGVNSASLNAFTPQWDPDTAEITGEEQYGSLYPLLTDLIRVAKLNPQLRFRSIFWKQGEADMTYGLESNYLERLASLVSALRQVIGSEIPFYALSYATKDDLSSSNYTNRQLKEFGASARSIQQQLATVNTIIPSSYPLAHGDLPLRVDGIHFSTAGVVQLGHMMAQLFNYTAEQV